MKLFDEIKPVFFIDNKMNDILNDINVKLKKINVNGLTYKSLFT